jgi:hypothetical protein
MRWGHFLTVAGALALVACGTPSVSLSDAADGHEVKVNRVDLAPDDVARGVDTQLETAVQWLKAH